MNICVDCQRPIGACSWEKNFTPVPGWTATKTKILVASPVLWEQGKYTDSYDVKDCPLFVPPPGYKKQVAKRSMRIIATNIVTGEETCFSSIREAGRKGDFLEPAIYAILRGDQYTHYGHTFRYAEENDP